MEDKIGLKEFFELQIKGLKEDISKILEQTTKTNGRLRLVEKFVWACGGGLVILTILYNTIIVPMVKEVQARINNLDNDIQESVDKIISDINLIDENGNFYKLEIK